MTADETSTPVAGRTVGKLFGGFSLLMKTIRRGFTLIELIVVILILGILAVIAIPRFAELIGQSAEGSVRTTAQSVDHEAMALGAGSTPQTGADDQVVASLEGDGYVAGAAVGGVTTWEKAGAPSFATSDNVTYTVTGTDGAVDGACVLYTPNTVVAQSGEFVPCPDAP